MPKKKKFKPNYPDTDWTDAKCKWHMRHTERLFSSMILEAPSLDSQCCCLHLLKSHHMSVKNTDIYSDMNQKKFVPGHCLKKDCGCKGFSEDNLAWLLQQGKQKTENGV